MISEKQKILLDFAIQNNNKITTKEAINLIGNFYYYNAPKHTGEVLTRMVKSGLIKRIKNGFYEIGKQQTAKRIINQNQLELL